jgi:NAD(P)H dehydrogenase (quinone)
MADLQMGGSQTAILTAATQLVHHSMIYVPAGCSSQLEHATDNEMGPGPWGSGTVAGQENMITSYELTAAQQQGVHFAGVAGKLASALM